MFWLGKSGNKVRDCPNKNGKDKKSGKASGSNDAPKKNLFYAFHSRGEQKTSPDVMTGMLKVFSIDVYAFLDPRDTLYFVTPLIAKKFDSLPDILKPFMITTLVGDSVVAKRVYRYYSIMFPNRVTHV